MNSYFMWGSKAVQVSVRVLSAREENEKKFFWGIFSVMMSALYIVYKFQQKLQFEYRAR